MYSCVDDALRRMMKPGNMDDDDTANGDDASTVYSFRATDVEIKAWKTWRATDVEVKPSGGIKSIEWGQRFDEGGIQALWKDPDDPGGWNAFDDVIKELEVDIEVLKAELYDIEGRDRIKSDDDLEEELKT